MSDWTIDADALRRVCPNLEPAEARRIADGLGEAFKRYEINTPRRAAMAVAQWGHESDHFRTATEYASGEAYEGREDLGNTQKGDGRRFRGRGRIQITGRANYEAIAKALELDCVANPDILASPPNSELASGHWWHAHGCNGFCDRNDFVGLTKRINGGTRGLDERERLYGLALQVADKLVPFDKWDLLRDDEREQMETLDKERRIAKRNGGWDEIDPGHLERAKAAKNWLAERRKELWHKAKDDGPDGWEKWHRRERYALIKHATGE